MPIKYNIHQDPPRKDAQPSARHLRTVDLKTVEADQFTDAMHRHTPLYSKGTCLGLLLDMADTLPEVFRRLHLFIRPGGLMIFDIRTPDFLRALDGQVFVDEKEDVLCLWRADFDEDLSALVYGMDLFTRRGRLWERSGEEHIEYAHAPETLRTMLEGAGFDNVRLRSDGPQGGAGRLYITARRNQR